MLDYVCIFSDNRTVTNYIILYTYCPIVYRYIQYLLGSERLKFFNFFTSKRLNLNIATMDVFILS